MVLVVLAYALPLASVVSGSGIVDRGVSAAPMLIEGVSGLSPVAAVSDAVSRVGVVIVGVLV